MNNEEKVQQIESLLEQGISSNGKALTPHLKRAYEQFVDKFKPQPQPQPQPQSHQEQWHEHDSDANNDIGYWQSGGYHG